MIEHRVGFSQLVALPFTGNHMEKLQATQLAQVMQRWYQRIKVMPVNRAHIVEPQFFEQGGRRNQPFGMPFDSPRKFEHRRHVLQHGFTHVFGCRIKLAGHQAGKIMVQRPYRR